MFPSTPVLIRVALAATTFIVAMSAFWFPHDSTPAMHLIGLRSQHNAPNDFQSKDENGARISISETRPSTPASLQSSDDLAGFEGIYGVGTLAIGAFYHGLLPAWLHALRQRARYQGPVFVGCDDCDILRRRLTTCPHAGAIIFLPLSRARAQKNATTSPQSYKIDFQMVGHLSKATKNLHDNSTNTSSVGSTDQLQKNALPAQNGTSRTSPSSFGGKGASRAAKASKWHHVLLMAEGALHEFHLNGKSPLHGVYNDSDGAVSRASTNHASIRAPASSKAIQLLFLDVDNHATRHLGRWLQHSLSQAFSNVARDAPESSTIESLGANAGIDSISSVFRRARSLSQSPHIKYPPQEEEVAAPLPHLLVGSGRRILGEPFNLGAFVAVLDVFPSASNSLMSRVISTGGRSTASLSQTGETASTTQRNITSSAQLFKEPAALACLRAAAAAAEASSIGATRFRPRINDQEALSRALASATNSHHANNDPGVHHREDRIGKRRRRRLLVNGEASSSEAAGGDANMQSSARCIVKTLPAGMQQFAASSIPWPMAEYISFRSEPPGLVHYTRAEQRLAGCTDERFKLLTSSSSSSPPHLPSPSLPSNDHVMPPEETHQLEHGSNRKEDGNDDAPLEWKSQLKHISGRRARSSWVALWQRTQVLLGLNSPSKSECWNSYQPLLRAVLNQEQEETPR